MNNTSEEYSRIIELCADIFQKKMKDYGLSWRILRPSSITDQIFIKAQRIRSIQQKGTSRINEGMEPEFIGIINYCIMGLVQLKYGCSSDNKQFTKKEVIDIYYQYFRSAKSLMEDKNHDYNEAWRMMRVSSITDLIMMKINRTKEIEDNDGVTIASEGIDANYLDIINYSVFALILLDT